MKSYLKDLLVPWKIITGLISIFIVLIVGRYAGDPTWDDGLSILMGLTTFLTSSFFVNTMRDYKNSSFANIVTAIVCLLVSAVWSYDYYNYFKLGIIPPSSFENILVSVPLYIISGIFWSLDLNKKYAKLIALLCIFFFASCFGFYYFFA